MSAIGRVVILKHQEFANCVRLAGEIRTERKGWGPFQKAVTYGREAFDQAWNAAIVEETDFAFSGYVLGDYLSAQRAINGLATDDLEASEAACSLAKVFTAAIPFEQPVSLPDLPTQSLHDFCAIEFGADAEGMFEALQAAHQFYKSALERLSSEQVAVFLII